MTITYLLNKIKDEKPNSFGDARLIAFINEIEADVADQLNIDPVPVYQDTDESKASTLLVPEPYSKLYISYVKAMVDYANEEFDSYANNQAQHVQDFRDFVDWVVRTKQSQAAWAWPSRFRNVM